MTPASINANVDVVCQTSGLGRSRLENDAHRRDQ